MEDEQVDRDGLRQYAWDYFSLHASQRLTTFNFYLLICGLVIAGYVPAIKDAEHNSIGLLLGMILTIISFVFWKLDDRNRQMIHNAEDALKRFEDDLLLPDEDKRPHVMKIFRYEEAQTAGLKRNKGLFKFWPTPFKYSTCFRSVFAIMALLGVILAIGACLPRSRAGDKAPEGPTSRAHDQDN